MPSVCGHTAETRPGSGLVRIWSQHLLLVLSERISDLLRDPPAEPSQAVALSKWSDKKVLSEESDSWLPKYSPFKRDLIGRGPLWTSSVPACYQFWGVRGCWTPEYVLPAAPLSAWSLLVTGSWGQEGLHDALCSFLYLV